MPNAAPPPVQSAYLRALYRSRRDLLRAGGLQDQQLRQMRESFARMLRDVYDDEETGAITEQRAEALRQSIRRRLADLGRELAEQTGDGADQAATLAAQGHAAALAAAQDEGDGSAPLDVDQAFAQVPRQALEAMFARRGVAEGGTISETFQTLHARGVQDAAEDIDRLLISGVGRGASNRRLTKEIATALAGDDEELLDVLENLGPRGGRTRAAIEEGIEIPGGQLQEAKRLLYQSRRIAVSEINAAHTAADDLANARSPVVVYVRWTLSSNHDEAKSTPDVCDFLAERDHIGEGPGVFNARLVPAGPHPFCKCWKRAIVRPESDWGAPEADPQEPGAPSEEEMLALLREHSSEEESITEGFAKRQRDRLAEHLTLARSNRMAQE